MLVEKFEALCLPKDIPDSWFYFCEICRHRQARFKHTTQYDESSDPSYIATVNCCEDHACMTQAKVIGVIRWLAFAEKIHERKNLNVRDVLSVKASFERTYYIEGEVKVWIPKPPCLPAKEPPRGNVPTEDEIIKEVSSRRY